MQQQQQGLSETWRSIGDFLHEFAEILSPSHHFLRGSLSSQTIFIAEGKDP